MKYVAVLDVESMGLYGRAFSFGIVIGDIKGNILEEVYKYDQNAYNLSYTEATGFNRTGDIEWVETNVTPHVGDSNTMWLSKAFYLDWLRLKSVYSGITLYADVPFPVETNFIKHVVDCHVTTDKVFDFSPYPFLDVTSFRKAHNLPDYFDRLPNELPIHHPLMDARQSYRGLVEVFNIMSLQSNANRA